MKSLKYLFLLLFLTGCCSNQKRHVMVPTLIDSRCYNDEGEFDPSLGWDDLDCGNLWFIDTEIVLKPAKEFQE